LSIVWLSGPYGRALFARGNNSVRAPPHRPEPIAYGVIRSIYLWQLSTRGTGNGYLLPSAGLDLPVVDYTSNKETKTFIKREAAKIEPNFTRASGTRYLLNRWREEQLNAGRRITYRDLVKQAIELNRAKRSPLRLDHGRYINFVSDFMAANENALREEAIRAWQELKSMDAPKTYASWTKARKLAKANARLMCADRAGWWLLFLP
jgi:hypothetical protein